MIRFTQVEYGQGWEERRSHHIQKSPKHGLMLRAFEFMVGPAGLEMNSTIIQQYAVVQSVYVDGLALVAGWVAYSVMFGGSCC